MPYPILAVAHRNAEELKEAFGNQGIGLILLGPHDDAVRVLENIAKSGGGIEAIFIFDLIGASPKRVLLDLPRKIRKLPSTVTFVSGLKLNALPIAIISEHLTDEDKPRCDKLGLSVFDYSWEDSIEAARKSIRPLMEVVRAFKKRLLADFDREGFAITPMGGGFRVQLALVRKRDAETEHFFWGPSFKPHVIFVGVDKRRMSAALSKYIGLIKKGSVTEREMQDFFEKNPDFLLQEEFDRLFPQVPLPGEEENFCDFVLRPLIMPTAGRRWKVIELKKPGDRLLAGPPRHRGFSANVNRGIRQLRDYADRFRQNPDHVHKRLGHPIQHPRLTLLIGKRRDEDPGVLSKEQASQPDVELLTYDEIEEYQMRRLAAIFQYSDLL